MYNCQFDLFSAVLLSNGLANRLIFAPHTQADSKTEFGYYFDE